MLVIRKKTISIHETSVKLSKLDSWTFGMIIMDFLHCDIRSKIML